ncbi:ATP-binding protein [Bacillus sp. JJ1764]|uniref:ATP-binding protein n=1 Tax=Bacillus sp. JJ1764 TaxID=3122964 RepID=UPI003000DA7E
MLKLVSMHIYGFGQLENLKIDQFADFQVFYGQNEAGKSTIMAFIHTILFGFPTKQQSELRYEPKHSTKYGGNLRVFHEELGYATIERVKGKAAGDVKVVLDNGKVGNEELLKELIANFDKGIFQSIYSFNLNGLQNIHQMKGEDLGKFLFSAGTLGTEQLARTENFLQKELDARFKPGGKKPMLNEKLQELAKINSELKNVASKNMEYKTLVKQKASIQQQMDETNKLVSEIQNKVEKLNEWKRIESIVKEEKWIKTELSMQGEIQFPTRGIERLEKLNGQILPIQAEINSLSERIDTVKNELKSCVPDHALLENEGELLTLLDQIPLYDQLKLETERLEAKQTEFDEKLKVLKDKLHVSIDEQDLLEINTNIYMRDQVEALSRLAKRLSDQNQDLEVQYETEKAALEKMELEVQKAQKSCLPEQDRLLLEKQVKEGDLKNLQAELKAIEDKIDFLRLTSEREKATKVKSEKQKRFQFFFFECILAVMICSGLLTKQWILALVGVISFVFFAVLIVKSFKMPLEIVVDKTMHDLLDKEKELKERLQDVSFTNITKLEEQLKLDRKCRDHLNLLFIKLEQQQAQFEKVIAKYEEWELAYAENKKKLNVISKELKIPENIASSYLLEAFRWIEESKTILREKEQLLSRLEKLNQQKAAIANKMRNYEELYLPQKGLDLHNTAYLLRNRLKEAQENLILSREKEKLMQGLEAEIKHRANELDLLQAEYQKLIQEAGTDTEHQFYELGEKAYKTEELKEKLTALQKQLHYTILTEEEREVLLNVYKTDELISECNQESQKLRAKLKNLQEEQASIKHELQLLEEGGTYSDILHHFKQKKYELEEAAKEWTVYALAQKILKSTIDKYKNDYLPRMLKKAEDYFFFLTNGHYQRIHLHPIGIGFLVERDDHTLFEANELSQATTEQLYVSVRLALVTTLYDQYPFPIMIDDSFVNFDAGRTEKVINLLQQIKPNQILFFTCHSHLLPLFQKESILSLEKGTVQIIS